MPQDTRSLETAYNFRRHMIETVNQKIRIQKARTNLLDFARVVRPNWKDNWHFGVMAEKLDKWVNKEIRNLMIFLPTRSGKSEFCSRILPSYLFGKFPDARVMAASYGQELASAN